jgi:hypothetical protein
MAMFRTDFSGLMFTAFKSGFSFNSFYRSARTRGRAARRSDMLADWHTVGQMVENEAQNRQNVDKELPIVADVIAEEYTRPEAYYYRLALEVREAATGQREERFVTLVAEEALTMGEIRGQLLSKWGVWEYQQQEELEVFELVSAVHALRA